MTVPRRAGSSHGRPHPHKHQRQSPPKEQPTPLRDQCELEAERGGFFREWVLTLP